MKRLLFFTYLFVSFIVACFVTTNIFAAILHDPDLLGARRFLGQFYEPFQIVRWFFTIPVPGHTYTMALWIWIASFALLSSIGYRFYIKLRANITGAYGTSRWLTEVELGRTGALAPVGPPQGLILGQSAGARYLRKRITPKASLHERRLAAFARANGYEDDPKPSEAGGAEGGASSSQGEQFRYVMWRQGKLIFSHKEGSVLLVAPPGGGKNVSVIVPSLLTWLGSAVVYDVKNENFNITNGWRNIFSYVYRFEPASKHSVRFNPLFEIEKGENEVAQTQVIADILVNPNGDSEYGSGQDAHWKLTAKQLLIGAILHVLYAPDCPDKSLRGVYSLLNDPAKGIREVLSHMNDSYHLNPEDNPDLRFNGQSAARGPVPDPQVHPVVAETARNMMNKADNELSGVVSTASSYLQLFQDPIVAENTRTSDFRISELTRRERPCTLYLCVSPQDVQRMQPLVRLILQLIAGRLTADLQVNTHPMLLVLDEFPTLGKMDFFEKQLAFFRGYKIRTLIVIQSFNQLFGVYGQNTSIVDNCAEIAILGVGHRDAKTVSAMLGSQSINRASHSRSVSMGSFFEWTRTTTNSEAGRPLMTDDELTRMPYDEFILISQGKHPYKGKKILYYQDKRMMARYANQKMVRSDADQRRQLKRDQPAIAWLEGIEDRKRLPASNIAADVVDADWYQVSDPGSEEIQPAGYHTQDDFAERKEIKPRTVSSGKAEASADSATEPKEQLPSDRSVDSDVASSEAGPETNENGPSDEDDRLPRINEEYFR